MKFLAFLRKARSALFWRVIGKIFYQPRIDKKGNPVSLRPFFGEMNRKLMEKGYTPPWIMTRAECWELHTMTPYASNIAHEHTQKPAGIVEFLHEFWRPQVGLSDNILELGSGPGANLYHLYKLGYSNLLGMEISQNAVDAMKKAFPEVAMKCNCLVGSLEDLLSKSDTDSVDIVFTMAVAELIHPTSNFLFSEMVRVARKYVCTIELEVGNCIYLFPRNYRRVFQRLGCPQLKSVLITKEAFPGVSRNYDGHVARLFSVKNKSKINHSTGI